jgi:hypothetical protein
MDDQFSARRNENFENFWKFYIFSKNTLNNHESIYEIKNDNIFRGKILWQ